MASRTIDYDPVTTMRPSIGGDDDVEEQEHEVEVVRVGWGESPSVEVLKMKI